MQTTEASHRPAVLEAAQWLATGGADKARSPIPQIKERFGLSLHEAAAACREAHLIRARAN